MITRVNFRSEAWHIQDTMRSGPEQPRDNQVNCGVYISYYAETLMRSSEVTDDLTPFSPTIFGAYKPMLNLCSPFSPSEGVMEDGGENWDKVINDIVDTLHGGDLELGSHPIRELSGCISSICKEYVFPFGVYFVTDLAQRLACLW